MSDNMHKWRDAVADAHTAAVEAFAYRLQADGFDQYLEDGSDEAHEYADGSEWSIYTWRAICLWVDSREVQECEGDIEPHSTANIDERIRLCVYSALRDTFAEKWAELYAAEEEKHDTYEDDDEDAEEGKPASEPRGFMDWSFTREVVARKDGSA